MTVHREMHFDFWGGITNSLKYEMVLLSHGTKNL